MAGSPTGIHHEPAHGVVYEPGQRTGAWQKMKTQQTELFVFGGYIGAGTVDELVVGDIRDREWQLCCLGQKWIRSSDPEEGL
jgi:hypothetical protein